MKKATLNRRSGFAGHTTYLRNIQPREGLPARRVAGLPAGLVAGPACASYFEEQTGNELTSTNFSVPYSFKSGPSPKGQSNGKSRGR